MNHSPLQSSELLHFFCTIQNYTMLDAILFILSSSIDGSYLCWMCILRDVNGIRFIA